MLDFLAPCRLTASINLSSSQTSLLDLPQAVGWLPKWQLFIAATAVFNSVQNFATIKLTQRVYDRVPGSLRYPFYLI